MLRGDREATLREAAQLASHLTSTFGARGAPVPAARTRQLLGQSFDAVVLDLHDGVAADTLGRCHGLVRGGGALILCLPPLQCARRRSALAVPPYTSPRERRAAAQRLNSDSAGTALPSKSNNAWFSHELPDAGSVGSQPLPATAVQVASQ